MIYETEYYWANLALQTRRQGHCYVHAPARNGGFKSPQVTYSYTGWGRSLQAGGHKYKVHAHYADGKPVPTKILETITRP
jgi:hypothetical protein